MRYQYEAMDKTGQEVKDQINATDQEDAMAQIRHLGLFVTKIASVKSGPVPRKKYFRGQKNFFIHPLAKPFGIALAIFLALPVAYFFAVMMGSLNERHAAAFNPPAAESMDLSRIQYAQKFEFEGHQYIRFGFRSQSHDPVVHDPECPKCKKNGHN